MTLRVLAAAAVSAVLMFLWGFVYWGPVLNMTARLMAPLPAEAELDVLAPLRAINLPDGMYAYPDPVRSQNDQVAVAQWTEKVQQGPLLHMAYHREGVSPLDPAMFAKGLAHSFVVALLCGVLLALVAHGLPGYGRRVGVLLLVALIAAIWTNVANVIWWFHAPQYCLGNMAYELGAGALMALATAAIVRTASPA